MTFPKKTFGKRLSQRLRRAAAACVLAGSFGTASVVPSIHALSFETHDMPYGVNDVCNSESSAGAAAAPKGKENADYWIFANDFCGWASTEAMIAPYSVNLLATEPIRVRVVQGDMSSPAAAVVEKTLAAIENPIRLALAALARQEPIDAVVENPKLPAGLFCGASPIIVSIDEGYLPYDLSRADRIAMKMYPISIPRFHFLDTRRAMDELVMKYGTSDCLGNAVRWSEVTLPTVEIKVASKRASMFDQIKPLVTAASTYYDAKMAAAESQRAMIAIEVVEALKPNSGLRRAVGASRVGAVVGTAVATGYAVVFRTVVDAAVQVAAALPRVAPERQREKVRAEELERSIGERLLVRAGIEADALTCATAGVADVEQVRVCCPVERVDISAQLPASHSYAAIGVAAATLQMPLVPSESNSRNTGTGPVGIARAEAVATACDNAAATLERLALALRRAGDSVVRVAKLPSTKPGTELR